MQMPGTIKPSTAERIGASPKRKRMAKQHFEPDNDAPPHITRKGTGTAKAGTGKFEYYERSPDDSNSDDCHERGGRKKLRLTESVLQRT